MFIDGIEYCDSYGECKEEDNTIVTDGMCDWCLDHDKQEDLKRIVTKMGAA